MVFARGPQYCMGLPPCCSRDEQLHQTLHVSTLRHATRHERRDNAQKTRLAHKPASHTRLELRKMGNCHVQRHTPERPSPRTQRHRESTFAGKERVAYTTHWNAQTTHHSMWIAGRIGKDQLPTLRDKLQIPTKRRPTLPSSGNLTSKLQSQGSGT